MLPLLFLLLSLCLGPLLAAMNCPPGYAATYSIDADRKFFVRCCNETAPGGRACASPNVAGTAGDYIAYCIDIFPILNVVENLCDCGRLCTGTVTQSGCAGPDCLCTTRYCCIGTGLCNASSPASYTVYTLPPTPPPSPAPSRAPTTPAPSQAPTPPTEAPVSSGDAPRGTLAILMFCLALMLIV